MRLQNGPVCLCPKLNIRPEAWFQVERREFK
jgi:hypothetical protein